MKRILIVFALILLITCNVSAQNKSEVIYNNGLTHDNIKADIFNSDTTYVYSVTTAAMWSGKQSTKIIYKGTYSEFMGFMIPLLQFAEQNKDNKGAKSNVCGINIESTKKIGIKCISIGDGKNTSNTNYNSIKEAVEAILIWKK